MDLKTRVLVGVAFGSLVAAAGCSDGGSRATATAQAQSCMVCHNGSPENDYAGPGIEDPHPFGDMAGMLCTTCHGGNGAGQGKDGSHVPAPPAIGGREQWETDRLAYFNRLTRAGLDKLPPYEIDGVVYTALDYLQFIAPGDLRVTEAGRGCGQCHADHSERTSRSMLATAAGIFSGATYAIGEQNAVAESRGRFEDTAADRGFRAIADEGFQPDDTAVGEVGRLLEHPVYSRRENHQPDDLRNNDDFLADALLDDQEPDGRVVSGSPLSKLFHEQVAFTCGDCHLGSSGANDRAGDFRGSGCAACHMPYSLGGRSLSGDPNIPLGEPADPDDIDEPELPHLRRHRILSVAQTLSNGEFQPGIDDHSCAGCHQGSNRTVMQYWGIRLDQNQDVHGDRQYPANPVDWEGTGDDQRLFPGEVGNHTFNGRNRFQYLAFEDYDGDGRDDTPPDVHSEAGMGCIDCHGSGDLHGAAGAPILSRMEQAVAIRCESCHGAAGAYAPTVAGTNLAGAPAQLAVDERGDPLRHVERDAAGHYWLTSKLTGQRHYVRQTLDVVVDNGRAHPETGQPLYSAKGSFAMGRADGDPATGLGPIQVLEEPTGFSHGDGMSCASCHASWTNSCIGCHLEAEYDNGQNFSNITGERIVFRERNADFTYQSPVPFQLGVGPRNEIETISPNTLTFFQWRDQEGDFSKTFTFSDRNGKGSSTGVTPHPSLSHNAMMPHSIRGKVDDANEGPRACVACHLTEGSLASFGTEYELFRAAMQARDYGALDFPLLQEHIGRNPGNQLDSPLWVHMVAGLGSGLFLFDEHGCPINPLDTDADRRGCDDGAPSDHFDPTHVAFDLDRIVDETGAATGSNNHPMLAPGQGPNLREGATNTNMSGPLGWNLIQRLTDPVSGIVLDAWIDADGAPRGGAGTILSGGQ